MRTTYIVLMSVKYLKHIRHNLIHLGYYVMSRVSDFYNMFDNFVTELFNAIKVT